MVEALPVGQEYRDLVKLIPGVQYSEDAIRGPSAGGSGQDNVYQFDGVNVNLPLFGTLSAEPSSHDISEIAVVKGGANAIDFNRAAGFSINSVSKSGTNEYKGSVSYQLQSHSMTGDRRTTSASQFDEDKDWAVANFGGPILQDRLYFYASYFRPTVDRANRANLYGEVPDLASDRDEFFGKLTFAPTDSLLIHGSYRTSDRTETGFSVTNESSAGSTSVGNEATLDIGILEGNWVIGSRSYASFKFTDFANETSALPDNLFGFRPTLDGSVDLNIGALDTQGQFNVPLPLAGQTAFNTFIAPFIDRYGFACRTACATGGGRVGGLADVTQNDFFRQSLQGAYDFQLGNHNLHVGYQWYLDEEDLLRTSNGWGTITIPGGRINCPAGIDLRRPAGLLPGPDPAAGRAQRADHPLRVRVAQLRDQRRDPRRRLHRQPGPPDEQRRALRHGPARDRRQRLRLRARQEQPVQDVRDRLGGHPPAASRRHLGLQRRQYRLRQPRPLRARRPARCRAPRPGPATRRR